MTNKEFKETSINGFSKIIIKETEKEFDVIAVDYTTEMIGVPYKEKKLIMWIKIEHIKEIKK